LVENEPYEADSFDTTFRDSPPHFLVDCSIVLLVYSIADESAPQLLEETLNTIPSPPAAANVSSMAVSRRMYSGPTVQGIRLQNLADERAAGGMQKLFDLKDESLHYTPYVPMEKFPVVIAGHKPENNPHREISDKDIQRFISNHQGCTYGGDFALDNLEEIDAVFLAVSKRIHDLRKVAISPSSNEHISSKYRESGGKLKEVNVWENYSSSNKDFILSLFK
jgi:hypothetical protein